MANLNQPDDEVGKLPIAATVPGGMSSKGAARRRFAKAGVGGGVILTLASQPALATTKVCVSPSGACSSNLSRHDHMVACIGCKPDYWTGNHSAWKGALTNGDAKFRLTFPCTSRCTDLTSFTCFQIVDPHKIASVGQNGTVASHIMATMLNVRSKRIGFLTESQVMAIWNSYAANGYYKPTSTVTWNSYQIVAYLQSTMS